MRLMVMYAALFSTMLLTAQQQPKKTEHATTTSNTAQSQMDQSNTVISGKPRLDTSQKHQTCRHENDHSTAKTHDWIDKVNAASTTVMAIFTVGLFILVFFQLRAYQNKERAWVMVDLVHVPGYAPSGVYTAGDSFADIRLVCRNDGATPAWIDEVKAAVATIERTAKPPAITKDSEVVFTGPMPVGVGKDSNPIDFNLTIGKSPDLGEHVVVYGLVQYRHPFGDHATTTFAYASSGGLWRRLYGHPEYNTHT